MIVKNLKIKNLTIVMVAASVAIFFGMVSKVPEFIVTLKDYQKTSEYSNVKIDLSYTPKKDDFYKNVAAQIEPLYPEFKFVSEKQGLRISSDDLADHESVKFILTELKAIEPGVFWSVRKGCLGKKCPVAIDFELVAKTLTVNG